MIWRGKVDSAIYGSSQPFLQWFQIARKVGVNNNTVLSSINGHFKKWTPLVSSRFYFPQQSFGQTLIKNFLKSTQVTSG